MSDGSRSDTIRERQDSSTLPGTGDVTPVPATELSAPAGHDPNPAVPQTITPDPALCPTVTGATPVSAPDDAGVRHGDTIPLGSAPTLGQDSGPAPVQAHQSVPVPRPHREELIGSTVAGRYVIKSLLGAGGMGTVYLAEQIAVDRTVVLKFLHPAYSMRADLKERFHREARAASKLNHPNTIVLFDFGQTDDGTLYMAMEYLEGRTLGDLIESAGALSALRAIGITLQILTSLTEAHAKGVVHRDLKPDNILLVNRGGVADFVKVLDFGIAKIREQSKGLTARHEVVPAEEDGDAAARDPEEVLESWEELARQLEGMEMDADTLPDGAKTIVRTEKLARLTKHGEICGSPGYMAPEQIRGDRSIDHRADIYAVGVILYQLLTGTNPFKGRSVPDMLLRTMDKEVKPLRQTRPDLSLPRALDDLLLRCLSKDAGGRPGSAQEVAEQLREITPLLARQQKERERAMLELVGIRPRWRRHLRWALPLMVLGLGALAWFSRERTPEEGTELAAGQRVLVAASAARVPGWISVLPAGGQRQIIRAARHRQAARQRGIARLLAVAADIPSKYESGSADAAALEAETGQVAFHARGLSGKGLPTVQTFWTKIAVSEGEGRLRYVYDVFVFLPRLSASRRLKLRRHFAALRYDRYSFLLTEALRKRQCQRARELSHKEREAIEHLPEARHKGALSYLQYRLRKCTGDR